MTTATQLIQEEGDSWELPEERRIKDRFLGESRQGSLDKDCSEGTEEPVPSILIWGAAFLLPFPHSSNRISEWCLSPLQRDPGEYAPFPGHTFQSPLWASFPVLKTVYCLPIQDTERMQS